MSPTIMVLTDSPHVPTTDSLTGNTCKITKKIPEWWEDWFATGLQVYGSTFVPEKGYDSYRYDIQSGKSHLPLTLTVITWLPDV